MTQRATKKTGRRKKHLVCIFIIAVLLLSVFLYMKQFFPSGQTAGTEHGWNLILVNHDYRIPNDWDIELTELSNGQSVDSRIYPELQQMFDDMRADGIYPVVASGYRSANKQQELMDEKIEELKSQGYSGQEAKKEAKRWVADVGYSEHQTGLAVDINADGVNSTGNQVYEWLAENSWKYGFILRYPQDKEEITGTAYEPWHYRYVGKDAASEIYQRGLCLEEYIEYLKQFPASGAHRR